MKVSSTVCLCHAGITVNMSSGQFLLPKLDIFSHQKNGEISFRALRKITWNNLTITLSSIENPVFRTIPANSTQRSVRIMGLRAVR